MSNLKKTILYAIIPAIIAGLFSIAPKLYDLVTEEKAELSYNITDGPALEDGSNFKKIYSITIVNNGKKSLNNIQAELITDGKIEKTQIQNSSGLKPIVVESDNSLSINIPKLHPTENLGISAMLQIPDISKTIKFNLRSNEIVGLANNLSDEKDNKSKRTDLLGSILAGLSVFLMAILVSTGKISSLSIFSGYGDREDNLYYIASRLDLQELKEEIYKSNNNMSYMRTADFLLQIGIAKEDKKKDCILALKFLLFIKHIAPMSRSVVIRNLKKLDNKIEDNAIEELKDISRKMSGLIDVRNEIDKLLSE